MLQHGAQSYRGALGLAITKSISIFLLRECAGKQREQIKWKSQVLELFCNYSHIHNLPFSASGTWFYQMCLSGFFHMIPKQISPSYTWRSRGWLSIHYTYCQLFCLCLLIYFITNACLLKKRSTHSPWCIHTGGPPSYSPQTFEIQFLWIPMRVNTLSATMGLSFISSCISLHRIRKKKEQFAE